MIIEIFTTLVGILAAWVLTRINKNLKLSYISKAVDELTLTVEQTVLELQQTLVERLKSEANNGKLTSSEIHGLNSSLLTKVKKTTSDTALGVLADAGIDTDALILKIGESMINRRKNDLQGN